ncbi:MAG: carbon-nitrogen hydrolase family protein, partial [Verrucomicrobia bacterium]|nr:carbon-nitrogen hydrolase family protein [Verrucomicrobiota bacterium]
IPDGAPCRDLRQAARQHRIWVCAGLTERAGPQVFNAAVLISDSGEVVLHHRKINELDFARDLYACGDRVAVADTPLGRLGLMICADAFVPGHPISRTLGAMGAQLILSPSSWAVPADHDPVREPYGGLWRDSYGPVAREFGLWIAGCSNVGPITGGPWAGRRCIGCSLLVDPSGQPVLEGPYGADAEALLMATLRLEPQARQCRTPVGPG